jgi:hypothetical protein
MDTTYKFWCELTLQPARDHVANQVSVTLDGTIYYQSDVVSTTTIKITQLLIPGPHDLCIFFQGNSALDQNQALKIVDLTINGVCDPRFVWAGEYTPNYPEPWFSEQIAKGHSPSTSLSNTDYLGWNGTWCLRFGSPMFTWIHQTQNLGWIYD